MIAEIIIAMAFGVFLGIITGLTPGLHVNSVAALMLSFSAVLLHFFSPLSAAAIIVAMSISHLFFDFLPAIFLGAPEESTALGVLPGHKLLLNGDGLLAFRLAVFGCLSGLLLVVLFSPLFVFAVPYIFNFLTPLIGAILLFISFFVILNEKNSRKRLMAFSIFLVSGILGIIVFKLNVEEPLLPLLAGLFGISTIIKSLLSNIVIPEQNDSDDIPLKLKDSAKSLSAGFFSGSFISIFPAVGPAQSAILARSILRKISARNYMVMLGCISSVSAVFALITLYSISKARNGAIAILSEFIQVNLRSFFVLLLIALISAGISVILSLNAARYFSKIISKVNYKRISLFVILFILSLVFASSGIIGIFILITATSTGLIPILTKTGRHNLMGCLTIPVILFYL